LTKSGRRSFEKILNVAVAVYAFQKVFSWAKIASGVFNVEQRQLYPVSGISALWNELSHQVAPSRPKYGTGLGQTEEEK